jgi:hypothetical protein
MRIKAWQFGAVLAAAAVAVSTFVAVGSASASADAAPRPCGIKDISFYYGGAFEGLGLRTFDITLLAHDGISCSLPDTPLVTVGSPPSAGKVAVSVGGRGGTLVLRPDSPLHAVVAFNAPDTPEDTSEVNSLTLAMPGGTSAATFFEFPGVTDIATTGGVNVTAWTTGIGPGEEAND